MSITGIATGCPAISSSRVRSGLPGQSDTSVEVPPMSKEMTDSCPARRAQVSAPITPPAGPERTVWTGSRRARATGSAPPFEPMMRTRSAPASDASRPR
jgi:hypothetical protein